MYWMDSADSLATCNYMTGCDGTNNPYPVSAAIAENAEALHWSSCHDNSGPGSACNPLEGEIWSTD